MGLERDLERYQKRQGGYTEDWEPLVRGGDKGWLVPWKDHCWLLRAQWWDEGGGREIREEATGFSGGKWRRRLGAGSDHDSCGWFYVCLKVETIKKRGVQDDSKLPMIWVRATGGVQVTFSKKTEKWRVGSRGRKRWRIQFYPSRVWDHQLKNEQRKGSRPASLEQLEGRKMRRHQ